MSTDKPYVVSSPAAWTHLLQRCGAAPLPASVLYAELAARYNEPGRHYHTLAHVGHVLAVLAALAGYAGQSDVVRLGAWLHDVVYEPGAGDNEARSAAWASARLRAAGVDSTLLPEVARLIVLTTHHESGTQDRNGAVLLDADLAVLGALPGVYDAYARAIRLEYAHIGEQAYNTGRARVLQRFLARPALYYTPPMRAHYEARARSNLERELDRLQRSI